MRLSAVVLPEPEGPLIAVNSPLVTDTVRPRSLMLPGTTPTVVKHGR